MPWLRAPCDALLLPLAREAWPALTARDGVALAAVLKRIAARLVERDAEEVAELLADLGPASSKPRALAAAAEELAGEPLAAAAYARLDGGAAWVALTLTGWVRSGEGGDLPGLATRLTQGGSLPGLDPESSALYAMSALLDAVEAGPFEPTSAPPVDAPTLAARLGLDDAEEFADVEPFCARLHDGHLYLLDE